MTAAPTYVPGHKLLDGKGVVITAAAGTGIGFAAAKRCERTMPFFAAGSFALTSGMWQSAHRCGFGG